MNLLRITSVLGLLGVVAIVLLVSCGPLSQGSTDKPTLAEELTVHGWESYVPQSVLDAFTAEYGVPINYVAYGDPDDAIAAMRQGQVFDVVILGNIEVQTAAQEKLLAELDHRNLTNFSQVANDFRDLAFDPKNKYSVPFEWGTSGLLYRTDLVSPSITKWADLWNSSYTGKISFWPYERDVIGLSLKALGYSFNSENLEEIAQAGEHLMKLQGKVLLRDINQASAVSYLLEEDPEVIFGWAYDMRAAEEEGVANVTYILPEEGTIIWMDNLVIPANSPHKYTAELFLNFILRPEIGAQLVNEVYAAVPNEGAYQYIKPEILNNPLIFPTAAELENAEFYLPISPEAQAAYDEIWSRFSAGIR